MKRISSNIFLYILFILTSFFPPIFYSAQGVTDQFLFLHLMPVYKSLNVGHLSFQCESGEPLYASGFTIMLIIIAQILNIPPKTLQFLPIHGIILPFIYYSLCRKFLNSSLIAGLITVSAIYSVGTSTNFYTVWPHGWAYILYLVFVSLCSDLFKKKDRKRIILLILVFIAVHFYSYTVEMWSVSFLIILNLLLAIFMFNTEKGRLRSKSTTYISVSFLTVMLMFNNVIYDKFLTKGNFINTLLESAQFFFHKYFSFLPWIKPIPPEKYLYKIQFPVFSLINVAYLITLLLPIILCMLISLKELLKNNQLGAFIDHLNGECCFKVALLAVGIIDVLIYSLYGSIILKYVLFIFPLLSVICLRRFSHKNSFKIAFVVILVILAFSRVGLSWHYNIIIANPSKYTDLEPSATWFLDNSERKATLIDLMTYYKYSLEASLKEERFKGLVLIDSHLYKLLVEPESSLRRTGNLNQICDYIVLNTKIGRIDGAYWKQYEPFYKYSSQINNNINIYKVYDDGSILIFKT